MVTISEAPTPAEALNRMFLLNHPRSAAYEIEKMTSEDSAAFLSYQPAYVLRPVWESLSPGVVDRILPHLPNESVKELLSTMDIGRCAALLNRVEVKRQTQYFDLLSKDLVVDLRELMSYPNDSAGALMDTDIDAFNETLTVKEALEQLRNRNLTDINRLYLLNANMLLSGQVSLRKLSLANDEDKLKDIAGPIVTYLSALDPKSEILDKLEKYKIDTIAVVDGNDQFIGIIRGRNVLGVLKETMATDMLTMVGVSKDERALSSAWFTVKKRLPWLQINLATAFLAAAVVGVFEDTIAKYTALAILLPIAAGQSGNTGAQALAVTMRGLTLREIGVRHWLQVLRKETIASIINGIAIAITCGAGVYFWSGSVGLALIIALAMISSMAIAAIAGALVPILLKKFGQDPALSSSIILTTVTDIAGFISFLGIATMLSGMLEVPNVSP